MPSIFELDLFFAERQGNSSRYLQDVYNELGSRQEEQERRA